MTPTRLKHYKSKGWSFTTIHGHDHHTGVPETHLQFKSPRTGWDWVWIHKESWKDVTEEVLLSKEREAYVDFIMKEHTFREVLRGVLFAALKKDPTVAVLQFTLFVPVTPL